MSDDQTQQLLNRLMLLLEHNATLSSTLSLGDLLQKIINVATVVVGAEASSLALVDSEAGELVFQFVAGDAEEAVRSFRLKIGDGIAGWVAKYDVPLMIADAQQDPRFQRKVDDSSGFVTRAVLCVPMRRNQQIIGILQALNKKGGGEFNADDQLIAEALANVAAIAIENSQLYHALKEQLDRLDTARKRSDSILLQLQKSEREIADVRQKGGQLAGQLGVFRVENLVQMLSNDFKTGCLHLVGGDEAAIYFDQGKIAHVEIPAIKLEGETALFDLMCWEDGAFSFEEGGSAPKQSVKGMAMSLVIEGLRRLDEYKVLAGNLLPLQVFKMVDYNDPERQMNTHSAKLNLDPAKLSVMRLIDGTRTVLQICRESGLDRYSAYKALGELVQSGLVST